MVQKYMADNEQNLEPVPIEAAPPPQTKADDNLPTIDVPAQTTDETTTTSAPETTSPFPALTSEPPVEPSVPTSSAPPQTTPPPAPTLDQKFSGNMNNWKSLLAQALAKKQQKKQDKLNKILALAQIQTTITNRQVKKLLRCTPLTAWRYLKILEKQTKLKRTGNHNTPTYELIK